MALILQPGTRVLDANGAAVSGGLVRVRDANTTTLSSLFSDAALTVPLTNPVVCNSQGYPSSDGSTPTLIFAQSANYDVAFLTAASVPLRSWEDVPGLGSDAATFLRDFTNSRFQITGTAGVIRLEAGDASPDNTGGTGKLGGWNGTQADTWTADAALFDTTGVIKEGGKKLPGVIYTDATTFTAQSTVDIQLPNSPTGVREWQIDIWDFTSSLSGQLQGRLSYDSGATYKAGAADYSYNESIFDANGGGTASLTNAISAGNSIMGIAWQMTAGGQPARITIRVTTVNSGSGVTVVDVTGSVSDRTTAALRAPILSSCNGLGNYGRATHIRLMCPGGGGGTLTGKYRVTPIRGSGET
jgi:hypothetical protein